MLGRHDGVIYLLAQENKEKKIFSSIIMMSSAKNICHVILSQIVFIDVPKDIV